MAKWPDTPVYTPIANINKGNEYQEADGLTAADMNAIVENIDYLYNNSGGSGGGLVDDVLINGVSIVVDKTANIPVDLGTDADSSNPIANKAVVAALNILSTNINDHKNNKTNPHNVTAAQLGLGNVITELSAVEGDISAHKKDTDNPHNVTKSQVGLGNVDNTSDADKPVSSKQAAAINAVEDQIILHKNNKSNPHAVTKAQVGLSNVDNTSDASKPISTAQQAALDALVNKIEITDIDLTFSDETVLYEDKSGIQLSATGKITRKDGTSEQPQVDLDIPIVAGNNIYAIKSGNLVVFAARDQVGVGTTLPSGSSPQKIFIKTDENYEGGGGGGGSTGGQTYRHLLRCSDFDGTKEYKIAVYSSKSDTMTTDYVLANPSCLVGAISSVLDNTQGTVTFDRLITGINQGPPGYFGIEAGGIVPSAAFLKIDSDSFAAL